MTDRFDRIYEKYAPMVMRRCQKLLGNEARAAEAMQDVFVQYLTYADKPGNHSYSSLLYRIATNVCLNLIRTDARHPMGEPLSEVLIEIADRSELESQVIARNFISKIFSLEPESTAWMAVFFYHDEMTLEEIAKESGLSVSGVRKRLRKFGMNLRKLEEET